MSYYSFYWKGVKFLWSPEFGDVTVVASARYITAGSARTKRGALACAESFLSRVDARLERGK
jgi:hypothetical protein